ncbi:hypothetical protein [Cognatishimia sp.]|uniref:hypothetical protein n=1 Tax=Cognatishimia sp. TaxID=2211648 RepID=UPI0035116802|nr:hypothetical protein [Cognatishimia sp.]
MSVWAEIINKIRRDCPIFSDAVIAAPEFQANRGNNGDMSAGITRPFVIVEPSPRSMQPLMGNETEQVTSYNFSTIVTVDYEDRTNQSQEDIVDQEVTLVNGSVILNSTPNAFIRKLVVKSQDLSTTYEVREEYTFDPYTSRLSAVNNREIEEDATVSVSYTLSTGGLATLDVAERCIRSLYSCLIGFEVNSLPKSKRIECVSSFFVDFGDKYLIYKMDWSLPTIIQSTINEPTTEVPINLTSVYFHEQLGNERYDDSSLVVDDYTDSQEDCYGP